jgi:aminoglycoside/choline kinase family phosphotransferase
MQRQAALEQWMQSRYPNDTITVTFAAADADFRRYFRVHLNQGTRIVMDAPPEKMDVRPYLAVQRMLAAHQVNVPQVLAHDLEQGFMELNDLGDVTLLTAFAHEPATQIDVQHHFLQDAIDTLVHLQLTPCQDASQNNALPLYDAALLQEEMNLFADWFCAKELNMPLTKAQRQVFDDVCACIIAANLDQTNVFVHRDFIVRNLMLTPDRLAVLDFQDAVHGPLTYDIASLLRDAFIEWPEKMVLDLVIRYWEKARAAGLVVPNDVDVFYRQFEWMAVQRHLKVAGIFARLYHRDGKEKYRTEIPRFIQYLKRTCRRYHELHPLYRLLLDLTGPDSDPELPNVFPTQQIAS